MSLGKEGTRKEKSVRVRRNQPAVRIVVVVSGGGGSCGGDVDGAGVGGWMGVGEDRYVVTVSPSIHVLGK